MKSDKMYKYCNVLPSNFHSTYCYIYDFDVKVGDFIVVPFGSDNKEKVGLVVDTIECTKSNAPYPPEYTKYVKRIFGENESDELVKQKKLLENEKKIRIITPEQRHKQKIKETLEKNGIGCRAILESHNKVNTILANVSQNNLKRQSVDSMNDLKLSSDGKTVVAYDGSNDESVIRIPDGVVRINDMALRDVKFNVLYINSELEYLGKFTIRNSYGKVKDIVEIKVSSENRHFASDEMGFYSITPDGGKHLEYIFKHDIDRYVSASDVVSIESGAFCRCNSLCEIILRDGVKSFVEDSLAENSNTKEITLSKTVEHISPRTYVSEKTRAEHIVYHIDEQNEHLFRDEDYVYEVLPDATYKLVKCMYRGKGRMLVLDGTSEIGERAFLNCNELSKFELPKSVVKIDNKAFLGTGFKKLVIPKHIRRIESGAFIYCSDLESVEIPSDIEYIAENTFGMRGLMRIKSSGKKNAFTYIEGRIEKHLDENVGNHNENKFDKFARRIVDLINLGTNSKAIQSYDAAFYDEDRQLVSVSVAVKLDLQHTHGKDLNENDSFNILMNSKEWEVYTDDGEFIGTIANRFAEDVIEFVNFITIINTNVCYVKTKRFNNGNFKYVALTINFDVVKKDSNDSLSSEDLYIKNHFAYRIEDNIANIIRWTGDISETKAVIPSMIEGFPVVSIGESVFGDYHNKVREIYISEGIKRIESSALFWCENCRKIVFPASLEYISGNVFGDEDGKCRDLYLHNGTLYVAPVGSYAEKFLKDYKVNASYKDFKKLQVVNTESV